MAATNTHSADFAMNSSLELTVPSMLTRHTPITIAVDPVALVITECITVSSAMRKHPRWAYSSVSAILGGGPSKPPPLDLGSRRSTPVPQELEDASWRWGSRSKKGKSLQDNPLMSAFTKLRSELRTCKDVKTFDTPALLHPFLQVIRSSSTSASITSLALIAVTKFLSYSVICRDSPRLPQAMQLLSAAITHCRFEASHSAADEVVYMRILKLMEAIISGPGGDILSDESVCQIMETGLGLCCDPRFTQILQRSAEISMVSMCQVIFERLKHLEIEAGDEPGALEEDTKHDMNTVKMETSLNGAAGLDDNSTLAPQSASTGERPSISNDMGKSEEMLLLPERPHSREDQERVREDSSSADLTAGLEDGDPPIKPYSLPSIKELFRSLVDLLDPHDKNYTDSMRVMALRIVDVALEVAGPSIANHHSLASLAKDTLCRHLFQLVRSENMAILNESLRVAGTLLATCRSVLKLQQELFLSYLVACLFPRVDIPQEPGIDPRLYEGVPQAPSLVKQAPSQQSSSGRSTPVPVKDRQKLGLEGGARKPDAREAMVESIGALVRMPSFMAELFVNYDCEIDRSDLCADMVGLLSRNAFPDSATWSTTNVPPLCLDALLGFVQSIADRLDDPPVTEGYPAPGSLHLQRKLKRVMIEGCGKFNKNPKAGITYLASQGVIENINDPDEVAHFLIGTSRLDKKVLGDFISKSSNASILISFLKAFNFQGKSVEEALRDLLYTFRLPGESQLIERIMTEFASKYVADGNHDQIADADSIFILTYAIIMLNTDQHNPVIGKTQKRMFLEDFAKNLRGTNGGVDYDMEYLNSIFESIKTREIILPEEHGNTKVGYDHAWKGLMMKIQSASDLTICNTKIFDADMFAATWKPIVATLSYVFMNASEDAVFSRVFAGFAQCARIAARHGLSDALDKIIFCLSSISTLASATLPNTSLNTEVQVNEKSVMVSETAVRFGRDDRAQQATVVLFRVLEGNEATVKDGWEHVVRIMLNLFVNSLITSPSSSFSKTMEPIRLQPPVQVIDRGERQSEGGLFSAFSSYVSSFTNDEPPEPSEQEIENTLAAVDCINQCSFDEVVNRLIRLPIKSLRSLLDTLLSQIPEDSSPRVISVKAEVPAPTSPRPNVPNGRRAAAKPPVYDPTLIFVLELATMLTLRDAETVQELGKDVASALQTVIRNASNVHSVTISRVVYYLLSLLRASNDYDLLRAPVLLHAFAAFDLELLSHCATPLINGISECINASSGLRKEMATSPDFWDILRKLHSLPEIAPLVFGILEDLNSAPQNAITADNYENTISLLNDFATAGSIGSADEQRRDQASRRGGKQAKPPKSKHREEVLRGNMAMRMVGDMTARVPLFISQSHLEPHKAWATYWSPIFRTLTHQCLNPCREIRTQAFSVLRQALLDKNLLTAAPEDMDKEWEAIFENILFPLITQLLKPDVYATDPVGMSETRVQAAQLLCRIFLHYLSVLQECGRMVDLWGKILQIMDRLMHSGQGDTLEEAVAENVKNILLVMSSQGYLVPPNENPEQEILWNETWKRLERFLPGLFKELFPEEAEKPRRSSKENKAPSSEVQRESEPVEQAVVQEKSEQSEA